MREPAGKNATELLLRWRDGDQGARERLVVLLYDDLRQAAAGHLRRERAGHTLQPTALVHEAYFRLLDQNRVQWEGRAHFMAVAASMMRRVLVDHGRRKKALKRGGGAVRVTLDDQVLGPAAVASQGLGELDLLALDRALEELAAQDEQQARIVELRGFGGLSVEETAEVVGISPATVKRHWAFALAWLKRRLDDERP